MSEERPVEDDLVKWAMADVEPMTGSAFSRGREALLERMERPARRRRHRPWLVAAAAVLVLVAGALVAPLLHRQDRPEVPRLASAAATDVLRQASSATRDLAVPPGQYLYVVQTGEWSSASGPPLTWLFMQDQKLETWMPADVKQEWLHRRSSTGVKRFLKGTAADLPPMPPVQTLGEWKAQNGQFFHAQQVSFNRPTPDYLAGLPRDPSALYTKLREEAEGDEGQRFITMVGEGLDTGLYPAALRKSVYQALTYLPTLDVVDQATDADGRPGTSLGVAGDRTSNQIIVNPVSGEYLGSRIVLSNDWDGVPRGTTVRHNSVRLKVVPSIGAVSQN